MKALLKSLCDMPSIGHLIGAANVAADALRPYCDSVCVDDCGNVTARRDGSGDETILLNAHIDQIGMIVTHIAPNGFLRVAPSGGVDMRVLPASAVTIHGKKTITGVFCSVPPHLAKDSEKTFQGLDELWIDTGLSDVETNKLISVGDYVTYYSPLCDLLGDKVCGASLDDRVGCAAVIRAMELLKDKELPCNVAVLLSTAEELGSRGAKIGSFEIEPTQALITDVSFAKAHGVPSNITCKIGGGAMIGAAPALSQNISDKLIKLAKENNIPYQLEGMGGNTGTDADAISISRSGVACGLLSIPQRNMHTPVEVCSIADIESVARLMAEYCLSGGVANV